MENKIAIKVNNLVKVYKMYNNKKDMLFENISPLKKNRHTDYYALNGISFDVKQGETFGIIGTNGAGKSTLFNAICGNYWLDQGQIFLDGQDITFLSEHRRARQIGRVFQDPMKGTAPHLTIEENLALAYTRKDRKPI